ncbi:unnamed protein product, partial [marine sediment metagenome]
ANALGLGGGRVIVTANGHGAIINVLRAALADQPAGRCRIRCDFLRNDEPAFCELPRGHSGKCTDDPAPDQPAPEESLLDLRGIAPDILPEGVSSEEFVRGLRDAHEERERANARLREALEFYGGPLPWSHVRCSRIMQDKGDRARAAIADQPMPEPKSWVDKQLEDPEFRAEFEIELARQRAEDADQPEPEPACTCDPPMGKTDDFGGRRIAHSLGCPAEPQSGITTGNAPEPSDSEMLRCVRCGAPLKSTGLWCRNCAAAMAEAKEGKT